MYKQPLPATTSVPSVKPIPISPWRWYDAVWMLLVAGFVFLLGGQADFPHVAPGESAMLLARDAGLMPDTSFLHPLWGMLVRGIIRWGTPEGILFRLHLVCRILLALSSACLYRTAFGLLRGLEGHLFGNAALHPAIQRLGAVLSGLLLLAPPVRFAAMAPHPAILCVFLCSLFTLLATFLIEGAPKAVAAVFGIVCAIGILEAPGFLMVAPFWVIAVLLAAPEEGTGGSELDPRVLSPWGQFFYAARENAPRVLFATVLAGGALFAAFRFQHSPGAEFRNIHGLLTSLLAMGREMLSAWRNVLPSRGSLLVVLGVYLPAFIAIRYSPLFFSEKPNVFVLLMIAAMGLVGTSILLPGSDLHLLSLIGTQEMKVAACLLAAITGAFAFVYLVQAGFTTVGDFRTVIKEGSGSRSPNLLFVDMVMVVTASLFIALQTVRGLVRGIPEAETRVRALLADYIRMTIDSADSRTYLVTDGTFDNLFRLEGLFRGHPVVPLAFSSPSQTGSRRQAAASLPDAVDRKDYEIGLQNLLLSWKSSHPDRLQDTAALVAPDLWQKMGLETVPSGTAILLFLSDTGCDIDAFFDDVVERVWTPWVETSLSAISDHDLRAAIRGARRQIAFSANEWGLYAESEGRLDLAATAYAAAREIDVMNFPARCNLDHLKDGVEYGGLTREIAMLAELFSSVHPDYVIRFQGRFRKTLAEKPSTDFVSESLRDETVHRILSSGKTPPKELLLGLMRREPGAAQKLRRLLAPALHRYETNPKVWLLWGWCGIELDRPREVKEAHWRLQGAREYSLRLDLLEAVHNGDVGAIAEHYASLLTMAPENAAVLRASMQSFMNSGRLEEGRRVAVAILQQDPTDPKALFVVGTSLLVHGETECALAYLLRAEEAGDHSASLMNNIAEAYLAANAPRQALPYAQKACAMYPDNPNLRDTLTRSEKALASSDPSQPDGF